MNKLADQWKKEPRNSSFLLAVAHALFTGKRHVLFSSTYFYIKVDHWVVTHIL